MTNDEAIRKLVALQDGNGDMYEAIRMAIEALSSERTGKWIYCEDEDEEYVDGYRCDQCGFFAPWDYKHKSPYFIEEYLYCPSCKARMKGGDSDDEK